MKVPKHILPVIVFSQFCCTSLWFAGNGVMQDLAVQFSLQPSALGHLTSAVQFGFISGTLILALLTVADRYSPSKVFLCSALAGALFNVGMRYPGNTLASLFILRFLTGFFLAGIYPVGMKIAADYYQKGLGKSLGYLVGALVLGTALPHLLKGSPDLLNWKLVVLTTSILAVVGGLLVFFLVPDGPYRKRQLRLDLSVIPKIFHNKPFRVAAFGYFGHMWELYAFWAFAPLILYKYAAASPALDLNVSLWSFAVIAVGGIACVLGGYASAILGAKRVATLALLLSGLCCLLSPLIFFYAALPLLLIFLLIWGMVVVADSPLFSTLVAGNVPAEHRGTALTIVNCIGFAITIVSIQLLTRIMYEVPIHYLFLPLALGPAWGLSGLFRRS